MTGTNAYEYTIESVENAAKTLLMLRDRPTIRAVDVATELGTARSTAHRMVSTLAQAGLLRRNDADKSYSAGHALVELGMAVIGSADLRGEIQPVLNRIAAATTETAHFLVRERDEVVFVAVAEGTHIVRATSRVGLRQPAHITSAGRCLLADLSTAELAEMFPADRELGGGTEVAVHERDELFARVAEAGEQGWSMNYAESEQDLFAVSVPVRDAQGTALGAISVSGPFGRLESRADDVLAMLREIVGEFERSRDLPRS